MRHPKLLKNVPYNLVFKLKIDSVTIGKISDDNFNIFPSSLKLTQNADLLVLKFLNFRASNLVCFQEDG